MYVVLGEPKNRKMNAIQAIIALVGSFILSFSFFMGKFSSECLDKIDKKNIIINNSVEFLLYAIKQMSIGNWIFVLISWGIMFVAVLRMSIWEGEDDRVII